MKQFVELMPRPSYFCGAFSKRHKIGDNRMTVAAFDSCSAVTSGSQGTNQ